MRSIYDFTCFPISEYYFPGPVFRSLFPQKLRLVAALTLTESSYMRGSLSGMAAWVDPAWVDHIGLYFS